MDSNNGFGQERKTFQGNWKCGKCGGAITSLPFEPDPARANQLKCRECYKKEQQEKNGGFR